jgi:large repetitive protein
MTLESERIEGTLGNPNLFEAEENLLFSTDLFSSLSSSPASLEIDIPLEFQELSVENWQVIPNNYLLPANEDSVAGINRLGDDLNPFDTAYANLDDELLGGENLVAAAITPANAAIKAEGTITINGASDFDGVPSNLQDDAFIYAGKGFNINGNTILPVQRDGNGNPILNSSGKQILLDNAVTVAPGYLFSNAPGNNPYAGLVPPQIVSTQTLIVPAYNEVKTQVLNSKIPVGTPTVTFNIQANPINNLNDWNNKFPVGGTPTQPKVVNVINGGLNVPNGVNLSNYVITVANGSINFNGSNQNLNNVVLIANNGSINLNNVKGTNASILASSTINANANARFSGTSLLANGSGAITFNGATATINTSDELQIISQGSITYNGATNTRGKFLSVGNFTSSGNTTIYGSVATKGNIVFNGNTTVFGIETNVGQSPTQLNLSSNIIAENIPNNSLVGIFETIDPDSNDTFTYSLVAGGGSTDNNAFSLVNNELRIKNSPDFEAKSSYNIRIKTTDSQGLSLEKTFTIGINNLNEAPIQLNLSNNIINEGVPNNSLVGTLNSIDPDSNDSFTYSLVAGEGDVDNNAFSIVNNELRIKNLPDFETKSNYSIRVKTTDSQGLSLEKTFTIGINNLNESPIQLNLSNSIIDENIPNNSLIGTFETIDPDNNDTFTYSLVAGEGDTDNNAFSLVNNELRINNSPDFEAKSSYSIRIKTTDSQGLSLEKTFSIGINNLNEPPIQLNLSNSIIDENTLSNSLIGIFETIDPDANENFIYSLVTGTGDVDNNAFSIVNNELRINNSPDFESLSNYSIRVKTTDAAGLSLEKTFTIGINNLNEIPTQLNLSNSSINEGIPNNSLVGTLSSIDPDGENIFSYSLVAGEGDTDNSAFSLVNNELRIKNSPDFESLSNYSIRVKTTDAAGLNYEKAFAVKINNLDETPDDIILSNNTIPENSLQDTLVGLVSC